MIWRAHDNPLAVGPGPKEVNAHKLAVHTFENLDRLTSHVQTQQMVLTVVLTAVYSIVSDHANGLA